LDPLGGGKQVGIDRRGANRAADQPHGFAHGWRWIINHDRAFWGQARTLEQAQVAASAQLNRTNQRFPRCEMRPFTENEGGGYLITFSDFPGVVASGATPEEAIHHGRDALDVYCRTLEELESTSHA
jgi:predicted RNase H-like HicB family nuclease